MKLNKVFFLFLATVCLLGSSCSDDEDEDGGANPDCVPTLLTLTENGTTFETTLGYNSERRISTFDIEEESFAGTVTYSNGKPSRVDATTTPFGIPGYFEYNYNSAGQLTQINGFATLLPGTVVYQVALEYNGAGQVTKVTTSQANPLRGTPLTQVNYSTFTYDSKGNVQKESVFTGTGAGRLDSTIEFTYDTQMNPINALEKLVRGVSSLNNVLTAIYKDAAGNVLPADSYSRVYKYNTDNYPTEYTETSQSGVVSTSKATYDCK